MGYMFKTFLLSMVDMTIIIVLTVVIVNIAYLGI